jgi:ATP-binding cassette subfamily B protein
VTSSHAEISSNAVPLPTRAQSRARLRWLFSFVRPHRRQFAVLITTSVLSTLLALLLPITFKQAIDGGIRDLDLATVHRWVAVAVVLILVGWVVDVINTRASAFSIKVLNDIRVELFAHVQRQGLDFFHTRQTGVVISRITNDVDAVEAVVNDGIFMVFVNLLTLVGIEVFMFVFLDWRLALATNVIFPVMLAATIAFRYYSTRAYRRTRERMAQVTAFLAESIGGMRVVQAFAAEQRMSDEFDAVNDHYRRANMETIYLSASYFPGVDWLAAIGTGIVLWYGGMLAKDDAVTLGVLFAFIAYLDNFFDPIQQLSQFYGSFLSAMAALDKIMDVMETEPTVRDAPGAIELDAVRGDVAIEGVSFTYGPGTPEVLHHVDLAVPAGTTVALVGHTGAGKSTLVKLLTRFHDPTSGRVTLDGHDLRDLRGSWLRGRLGIVPQEGFLFSATVAENIRFGRPGASDEQVRAAAAAVGADEFIDQLEDGFDTEVGERGNVLSAGQRQLIAFARAMLADPALLVLDEATSSVDVATELRLAAGLRSLVDGRTAFVVAHRLSTIRDADLICVVDDGRVVERGTHDELLAAGGAYAQLYGSWNEGTDLRGADVVADDVLGTGTLARD